MQRHPAHSDTENQLDYAASTCMYAGKSSVAE
jgi:hypothetical protein